MNGAASTPATAVEPIPPPPVPVIVMIHLPPLPGAPGAVLPPAAIVDYACAEARRAETAGVDGVLVENYGDAPFFKETVPPYTVAALSVIVEHVRTAVSVPVGVNVLRNDALAAMSIAAATGAAFIRVNVHCGVRITDQGLLEGRAAETLRLRRQLGVRVAIMADVAVKHSHALTAEPLAQSARDIACRGLADALLVTGPATGAAVSLEDLRTVRNGVPDHPVYVASGVTADNLAELLTIADGVIVGTSVKRDAKTVNPLDPQRLRTLVAAAHT